MRTFATKAKPGPATSTAPALHGWTIQRKLAVSSPADALERQADAVADSVMRYAQPAAASAARAAIQRQCAECEQEEEGRRSADAQSIEGGRPEKDEEEEPPPTEQGVGEAPREAEIQRKAHPAAATPVHPRAIAERLAETRSGGEPFASPARRPMEAAFGHDFSRVRVHRDGAAAELCRDLSAQAFTYGNHVYFGHGTYDPQRAAGRHLLAHELAHVVQQGQAASTPAIQRAAAWTAPVPNAVNSLADTAINGAAAGVTTPTFNGVAFGALTPPTVNVAAVAAGGFDATVTAVAANNGTVTENVLSAGPWRLVVPRATIGALFRTLPQCTGAGNSNFRARGDPSDAAMAAANLRHETRHANDRRDAFNANVVPWDTRLTAAQAAGTTYHRATAAAARTALFTAMGGTATQVRDACLAAGAAARDAYHATAAGGPISAPTDPNAAPDCSWSFARYSNPS
ncbi:MAG TPA: DUF4157 domain-containing protein [Thermoanaerobaculia bacterium]|nr:DUF4157 domain-containing protein [Thermoanaerobaculia bacterium]